MSRDIRNLVVAMISSLTLLAFVWYLAEHWLALHGIRYGSSSSLVAYLPGWTFFAQQLLLGFLIGLIATRWQALSRAHSSHTFSLFATILSEPPRKANSLVGLVVPLNVETSHRRIGQNWLSQATSPVSRLRIGAKQDKF